MRDAAQLVSFILLLKYKNQGVFVKHYAPGGNKVQKAIFSFKVKVKVQGH